MEVDFTSYLPTQESWIAVQRLLSAGLVRGIVPAARVTTVGPDKSEQFYARYDDLYSVLVRIQQGESIWQKALEAALPTVRPPTQLPETRPEELVSDHGRCNGNSRDSDSRREKEFGFRLATR